jgi:16S rRNA (guanine966-N2)-methyltransferase
MENRRQPDNTTAKPYNRGKYYQKPEGKPFGYNKYQSRDGNFSNRDNRSQGRDDNRIQNRDDNRSQGRDDNRSQGRDERRTYARDDNRSQGRDNRFQSRDNRFRKTNGKFTPRRDDRFQGKKRFDPRDKPKPWFNDRLPKIVSDMQVTEGKHRGKYMQSTTSPKVRPTARRVREIMFKILYRKIRAKRFLDLCAGSGTVGIEAVSRGALLGTFVERSAKMCSFIRKNMETCGIKDGHGEVVQMEVIPFLKQMKKRKRCWDVVYFDPPYDANYDEVLAYLSRGTGLEKGGVLVIEHHAEMFFPEKIGSLTRWRVIVQDETALSFFERK